MEIRTSVHPPDRPWPLDLRFYLNALGRDSSGVDDSIWVDTEDRLARVLQAHATALEICLEQLELDPVAVWKKADQMRRTAIAEGTARLRRRELSRAASEAAKAFRSRDFDRVVELLAPYSDILTEAQSKKLSMARRHVSEGDG